MRLEYLSYLLEIEKCRSISGAARALYIEQASLSAIVKGIEEELGFPIFSRMHNGVVPTEEGKEALALAEGITARLNQIGQISAEAGALVQPVRILSSPSINCALDLPISRAFHRLNPDTALIFHEERQGLVGRRVIRNEADIGLSYMRPAVRKRFQNTAAKFQVQVYSMFRDHLYLLMRRDHPLAGLAQIEIRHLQNVKLALLPHFYSSKTHLVVAQTLRGNNRYATFSNVSLIKHAILELDMLGVLSGYAIQSNTGVDNSVLQAVPIAGENDMELCLIHRDDRNLRPAEKDALRCIKAYFPQLVPPPFSPEAQAEHSRLEQAEG